MIRCRDCHALYSDQHEVHQYHHSDGIRANKDEGYGNCESTPGALKAAFASYRPFRLPPLRRPLPASAVRWKDECSQLNIRNHDYNIHHNDVHYSMLVTSLQGQHQSERHGKSRAWQVIRVSHVA